MASTHFQPIEVAQAATRTINSRPTSIMTSTHFQATEADQAATRTTNSRPTSIVSETHCRPTEADKVAIWEHADKLLEEFSDNSFALSPPIPGGIAFFRGTDEDMFRLRYVEMARVAQEYGFEVGQLKVFHFRRHAESVYQLPDKLIWEGWLTVVWPMSAGAPARMFTITGPLDNRSVVLFPTFPALRLISC